MASSETPQPPTEAVQNLVLDEVTGEKVSKTELKRRGKERERAARKAQKAPPPAPKKKNADEDEVQLDPRQYYERRSREIKKLKDEHERNAEAVNPYPHKFHVNTDITKFRQEYDSLATGEEKKDVEVRLAGRIMNERRSGQNLIFYELAIADDKIQVMCQSNNASEEVPFSAQHELLQRGDIIGIIGFPGRTNPRNRDTGELSIFARQVLLLTPCIRMMPTERYGFRDQEQRYRQRHLDMIMNPEVRQKFVSRSTVINHVRQYLLDNQFLEVETPMMNQIAGGATAKPFLTYHNSYAQELFMRVAPELYLKQLVVGGLPRVFEIGKQFRNEDADLTHNPEFTTCEFYEAYADCFDLMERTEDMVSGMVKAVTGSLETVFHTQKGEEYHVNWAKPWRRIDMMPALEEACGEKFPPGNQLHTSETNEFLRRMIKKKNVEVAPPLTNARMIDAMVGDFIEETCINPTFITGHPQMMSPLAKKHRSVAGLCERFEAFVCKKEIVNAYTELNDPFDQRLRFEEQASQKAQGDDEAQLVDETFCEALEFGLPPTAGWGMGMDRMVMFLTDSYSIRDVLTFPFMKRLRPEQEHGKLAAEEVGVEPQSVEDVATAK